MGDLSADADTSANLDSSSTVGSPLAQLSSRVGQLRAWQEQQRARLLRQQEKNQQVLEQKQAELAALLNTSDSSGGTSPKVVLSGRRHEKLGSPGRPSDDRLGSLNLNDLSEPGPNMTGQHTQFGNHGAPVSHEDTPLLPVQFETLLERELQRQPSSAAADPTAAPAVSAKRPFLKRGTGLERYRLRPGQVMKLKPSGRGGGGGGARGGKCGRGGAWGRASGGNRRGERIVLHSAPRGNGPSRPSPSPAASAPFGATQTVVPDPGDTLALLGDVRFVRGPAAESGIAEGRSAAPAAPASTAWQVGAGSLARPPQPGLGLRHRLAADGGSAGERPPPPARLNFPTIGRVRSHLPGGVITLDKLSRPPGGAAITPEPEDAGTPRGKREMKELKAFELLEQAAEDSSFCSNSSFISNLLHAASSTPERRPGVPVPLSPLAKEKAAPAPTPIPAPAARAAPAGAAIPAKTGRQDGTLVTSEKVTRCESAEEKAVERTSGEIRDEVSLGVTRRIPEIPRKDTEAGALPVDKQVISTLPSTVVRPNIATGKSDWSSAGVTSQSELSDWSVSAAVSEASRRLPTVSTSVTAPYARAPDSDISTASSLIGSPIPAGGSGALNTRGVRDAGDKHDKFTARGERDDRGASAASPDSDIAPEERLERYRQLRDQMRLELERRELEGRSSPPSTDTLRRSVRFDDRPDVFEITVDSSHDVTLTSEAGAMEESSAWETTGPSSSQSPDVSHDLSPSRSPSQSIAGLGSTQRLGQSREMGTEVVQEQSRGLNQVPNGGQLSEQCSGQNVQISAQNVARKSTGSQAGVSQNAAQNRSTSPPLPTHRLNRPAQSSKSQDRPSTWTPGASAGSNTNPSSHRDNGNTKEPTSRGRKSVAPEPFLFDPAGLERQRSALERELATFRSENALLSKLKAEVQQQRLAMKAQREEWEKWKKEEREKMTRRVEDERRKLTEERAKFEAEKRKYAEEWKKGETPELKVLNSKVSELETELRRRSSSWSQDSARLRSRVSQLAQDKERLEGLLRTAQQQLARQNARHFSSGAGPHRAASSDRPQSAGRKKPSLSRHRSAPELAAGGGSTSSVSTAGGRSSRTSLQDQAGRKSVTRGGGPRRSQESRSSASSPTLDDVRSLFTGGGSGGGGGRTRRPGSGRTETFSAPRRPPPQVRVVRDTPLESIVAPSPPPPSSLVPQGPSATRLDSRAAQWGVDDATDEGEETVVDEVEERERVVRVNGEERGGESPGAAVDVPIRDGAVRDRRVVTGRTGDREEMRDETRFETRGKTRDETRHETQSEARNGTADGHVWRSPESESSAVASSPFSWPAEPPAPAARPPLASGPPPPPPGHDSALVLSHSTLSASSALSLPPRSAPSLPPPRSLVDPGGTNGPVETSGGGSAETPSGRRDELSDGTVRVCYHNGDWKETGPQGDTVYFYAASGARQTTYRNGAELTEFTNGQIERKDPDGTTEIRYPCGTVTVLLSSGEQQTVYRDGTRRRQLTDGSEEVLLPSGKLEVHTDRYKKLVCPDGTIKFVYPDGRQETRYPNGRIRIRDRDGRLVVDTQP